jgi:CPA2 family monovalent cation:H+ antiporter-2
VETRFLTELLLVIAVATAGAAVFERLRLPSIVGFLVMGALVGPGGLGLIADTDRVRELAELGVVFLLFEVGLELPIERVRRLWRQALVAGGLQVAATLAIATAVASAFGLDLPSALVVGALVAMSSTAVVMRLLAERGELDAPHGQLAVGILLFQDLCIVPFLLAVPILAAGVDAGGSASVAVAVLRAVLALVALSIVARFLLPPLLDRMTQVRSREVFTMVAFLAVMGSAVIAESIGLTLAVGAFVGGLVLSATPWSHALFAEVIPLRGLLLGIFFTAVGMLFDPATAVAAPGAVVAWVGGVVALKSTIVAGVVALVVGHGLRQGILTGMALAQTGEFSFVLAAAAAAAGLLDDTQHAVFVTGSIGTLIATPLLVAAAPHVAGWLSRGAERLRSVAEAEEAISDHVVLVGFGLCGRTLARVLRARGIPYLAVESNARTVQDASARGEPVIWGDAARPAILERLGAPRARLVAVAISDPVATREVVLRARALAPGIPIVARTRFVLEVDDLQGAGATTVVAEEFESTLQLVGEALQCFGVPREAVARFAAELREEGYELLRAPAGQILDPWIAELLEEVATQWVEVPDALGAPASLAGLGIRARTGATVLAVDRDGVLTPSPAPDFALQPGDRLLTVGTPETIERLEELLGGR